MRCLTLIAVVLVIEVAQGQQQKGFYAVERRIAEGESSLGRNRWHINRNKHGRVVSVDCGWYQINSSHFGLDESDRLGRMCNAIFRRYGISGSMLDRTVAVTYNDMLNFELALAIYEVEGIRAWTSMRKGKQKGLITGRVK